MIDGEVGRAFEKHLIDHILEGPIPVKLRRRTDVAGTRKAQARVIDEICQRFRKPISVVRWVHVVGMNYRINYGRPLDHFPLHLARSSRATSDLYLLATE